MQAPVATFQRPVSRACSRPLSNQLTPTAVRSYVLPRRLTFIARATTEESTKSEEKDVAEPPAEEPSAAMAAWITVRDAWRSISATVLKVTAPIIVISLIVQRASGQDELPRSLLGEFEGFCYALFCLSSYSEIKKLREKKAKSKKAKKAAKVA